MVAEMSLRKFSDYNSLGPAGPSAMWGESPVDGGSGYVLVWQVALGSWCAISNDYCYTAPEQAVFMELSPQYLEQHMWSRGFSQSHRADSPLCGPTDTSRGAGGSSISTSCLEPFPAEWGGFLKGRLTLGRGMGLTAVLLTEQVH